MKFRLLLVLLLCFFSYSSGQTPPASPTVTPLSPAETRILGSSLKKYERQRNSQNKKNSDELNDDDVVKTTTDLVVNNVLVTNQKGNLILGLQKEDFVLAEDGVPQRIDIFSLSETVPRSIVLILENSVSSGPYQKKSIDAAKVLVNELKSQDRMAIVSGLKVWANLTSDKTVLNKSLDSIAVEWALIQRLGGSTGRKETWKGCSYDFCSLLAVLSEVFDGSERQPIIVFQSDAVQVIYLKEDKDTPYPVSYSTMERSGLKYINPSYLPKFGFTEVKQAIEKSRAAIYSVIPGLRFLGFPKKEQLARAKITLANLNKFYGWNKESDLPSIINYYQYKEAETRIAGQTAMFKVAELSGGFADFIEKPEDAENVYSNIFTVINNRYVIGYYPTNKNRDGKRREVKIQVRDHPEYTVAGRKAYILQ